MKTNHFIIAALIALLAACSDGPNVDQSIHGGGSGETPDNGGGGSGDGGTGGEGDGDDGDPTDPTETPNGVSAEITSSAQTGEVGDPFSFSVEVFPANANVDRIEFVTSDGRTIQGSPAEISFDQAGTFSVTVRVISGGEVVASAQSTVVVTQPIALQIESASPEIFAGEPVVFSALFSPIDTQVDRVVFTATTSQGTEVVEGVNAQFSFTNAGPVSVRAEAFVNGVVVAADEFTFEVQTPTTVEIIPSAVESIVGSPLIFEANIQPDGTIAESVIYRITNTETGEEREVEAPVDGSPFAVDFLDAGTFTVVSEILVGSDTFLSESVSVTVELPTFTTDFTASNILVSQTVPASIQIEPQGTVPDRVVYTITSSDPTVAPIEVEGPVDGSVADLEFQTAGEFTVSAQIFIGNEIIDAGEFTVSSTLPTVTLTGPTNALIGQTLLYTSSFTPLESADLVTEVRYVITENGVERVVAGNAQGTATEISFANPGQFSIVAQVFIGEEVLTEEIVVDVAVPVSTTITGSATETVVGGELSFTANIQPQGTVADSVVYRVTNVATGEEQIITAPVDGSAFEITFPNAGEFTVVGEVTVNGEVTTSSPVTVTATLPTLQTNFPSGGVLVGGSVPVAIELTPQGTLADRIVYTVTSSDPAIADRVIEGPVDGSPFELDFPRAGGFTVTAQVFIGNEVIDAGEFSVDAALPEVTVTAPVQVLTGQPVAYTTTVSPSEALALVNRVQYVITENGVERTVEGTTDGTATDITFPAAGTFTVTTRVFVGDEVIEDVSSITVANPVSVDLISSANATVVNSPLSFSADIQPVGTNASAFIYRVTNTDTGAEQVVNAPLDGSPININFPTAGNFSVVGEVTVNGETTVSDPIAVAVSLPAITTTFAPATIIVGDSVPVSVGLSPQGTVADSIVYTITSDDPAIADRVVNGPVDGSPFNLDFPVSGAFTVSAQVLIGNEVIDAGSFSVNANLPEVTVTAPTEALTGGEVAFTTVLTPAEALDLVTRIEYVVSGLATPIAGNTTGAATNITFNTAGDFDVTTRVFIGDEVIETNSSITIAEPISATVTSSASEVILGEALSFDVTITPQTSPIDRVVFTIADGNGDVVDTVTGVVGDSTNIVFNAVGNFTVTAEVFSGFQSFITTPISIVAMEQLPEFVALNAPISIAVTGQTLNFVATVAPINANFDRVVFTTSDGQSFTFTDTGTPSASFSFATEETVQVTAQVFVGDDVIVTDQLSVVISNSGQPFPEEFGFPTIGDLNGDGQIDLVDVVLATQRFGGLRDAADRDEAIAANIDLDADFDLVDVELLCSIVASQDFIARFISPPQNIPGGSALVISPNLVAPLDSLAITVNGFAAQSITQFAQGYVYFTIPAEASLAGVTASVQVDVQSGGNILSDTFTVELGEQPLPPSDATIDVMDFLNEFERAFELQQLSLDALLSDLSVTGQNSAVLGASLTVGRANLSTTFDQFRLLLIDNNDSPLAAVLQQALYANGLDAFRSLLSTTDEAITNGTSVNPSGLLDVCSETVPSLCHLQDTFDLTRAATTLIGLSCDALEVSVLSESLPADAVAAWTEQCPVVTSELAFASTIADLFSDTELRLRLLANPTEQMVGQRSQITPQLDVTGGETVRRFVDAQMISGTGDVELQAILADQVISNLLAGRASNGALVDLLDLLGNDLLALLTSQVSAVTGQPTSAAEVTGILSDVGSQYLALFIDQSITLDATRIFDANSAVGGDLSVTAPDQADFGCFAPGDANFVQFADVNGQVQIRDLVQQKSVEITCGVMPIRIRFGDNGSIKDDIFELRINGESTVIAEDPNVLLENTYQLPFGINELEFVGRASAMFGGTIIVVIFDANEVIVNDPVDRTRIRFDGSTEISTAGLNQGETLSITIRVGEPN
ncbi:beta strand repeat-containing protein [Sessilibacter sp. MAH4]